MYNYSIISLDHMDNIDEVCQDIKEQYEKGVSSCALFCFKLVPEGDPLIDKAEIQGKNTLCSAINLLQWVLSVVFWCSAQWDTAIL